MKDSSAQMLNNRTDRIKPLSRSVSSLTNSSSLHTIAGISPSSSHFFEVLYIGKVRISNRRISDGFLDAALVRFRQNELHRNLNNSTYHGFRRPSQDVEIRFTENELTNNKNTSSTLNLTECTNNETVENKFLVRPQVNRNRANSIATIPQAKKENVDQNRTMLFHVGRADLRLVSPDQKQILLYKELKDVVSCVQSKEDSDHFGVICRDPNNTSSYLCYVFKCESDSVVSEIIAAIKQSYAVDSKRTNKAMVMNCEHCPMFWLQKLLIEIEGLKDQEMQNTILKRIEELPEDEQELVLNKLNATASVSIMDDNCAEQNQLLITLLKAHCEGKQSRHVHDTAENRHEFLNHYLGGGTIFMKAKRSLTSSFDQLLKRKGSKESFGLYKENSLPIKGLSTKESSLQSSTSSLADPIDDREKLKNGVVGSLPIICKENVDEILSLETPNKGQTSPRRMREIFLKVGNSPRSAVTSDTELDDNEQRSGSWRHNILKNVITPKKSMCPAEPAKTRSRMELRELWKKAINQQILLIRMEKENAKLYARQEEATTKRIKLEYEDICSSAKENTEVWEIIITNKGDRKYDDQMLLQAIKKGIPRSKRGDVWIFLAEQFCSRMPPPIDTSKFPKFNLPYDQLLKELTSQQHAILIDLGRTFPNHSYFMSPLGAGQLALFNLLKAYSLLDEEVGYCQGLSFIAGVLLLHMSENEAFAMLRHLMFRRNLRQQYLPDMSGLQIQLYQLSRLLKDYLPELYEHFDKFEISPTLYAAPWMLTIFASQFPLGFVVRIFDFIFIEGPGVIFKTILALLSYHKDYLLACDGFEQIMDYLKITVPLVEKSLLEFIVKSVSTTDISKHLLEYGVEYNVLQEELSTPRPETKKLKQMEEINQALTEKNQSLMKQLEIALSNNSRLETVRVKHLSQINKLESEVRALEVTVAALGNFISSIAYGQTDIEIPNDVLRILSQLNMAERRKSLPKGSLSEFNVETEINRDQNITLGQIKSHSLSPKVGSSFFAKSFDQIRQQKLGALSTDINKHGADNDTNKCLTKSLSDSRNIKFDKIIEESSNDIRSQSLGRVLTSQEIQELKLFQKNYSKEFRNVNVVEGVKKPLLKGSKSNIDLNPSVVLTANDENSPYPLNCGGVQISYTGTTKLKCLRPSRTKSELQIKVSENVRINEHEESVDSNGNISEKTGSTVNAIQDSKLNNSAVTLS